MRKKVLSRTFRVLIAAGATCEDIDSVRFITNRSTGKMGIAVANAAGRCGYETRLLLGETAVISSAAAKKHAAVRFRSAADLLAKIEQNFAWCDWLVMTAAVADFTPVEKLDRKYRKTAANWQITLKRTVDILARLADNPARPQKIICGFSLTDQLDLQVGEQKLRAKRLDLLVANGVGAMGNSRSSAALIFPARAPQVFTEIPKMKLAKLLIAALTEIAAR